MATIFPPIPPPGTPFEEAVKETLEILLGIRGIKNSNSEYMDRAILYRELLTLLAENVDIITAVSTGITSAVGFGTATEKTISGGVITVTGQNYFRHHTVDTEGDAASDDLDTINGGSAGELLLIHAESGSRTVVCKNGASLVMGNDFSMDNIGDSILFLCVSQNVWYPLTKYNAGS
jgi:hypothetical protein